MSWLIALLLVVQGFAQTKTVTGQVTDAEGEGLPGVSVIIKGTNSGTITDAGGNFSISVDQGAVLVFQSVGMVSQEVTVGAQSVLTVSLDEDTEALDEVIVTAQGIERKKEALGFAVSSIDKDALEDRTEGDLGRALRSKAAGVQITQQSGISGSGTSIVIRGFSSITGGNQPLFIVDGVPFNADQNSSGGNTGNFSDGTNNGSSRFLDLDPNNIEDIQILKGLAAATLYGSAGRNGVILITTKAGSSTKKNTKADISVSQGFFVNEIASMPDYQDSYGNGFDQVFGWFFSNWGPSFNETGLAGWSSDASVDENGNLPHPYSQYSNPALRAAFPQFQDGQPGNAYPYVPYDNVEDFFRKGMVYSTSVSARGRSKDGKSVYNASFGYLSDEGFTPNNKLDRLNFSLGGRTQLSNNVTINGTFNFSRTEYFTPPVASSLGNGATGNGSSVFGHLFFTPRSIDLMGLPFENPVDGSSVYYRNGNDIQNPRWTAENAFVSQLTLRSYGTIGATYNITPNLFVNYRLGYDLYSERNESGQHKGGVEGPLTGQYRTFDNINRIWDHTFTINGQYNFGERFGLSFNVGANARSNELERQGVTSQNQLVFGVFRHFNFDTQTQIQETFDRNIFGFFAQTELSYNNYLFLTLAGRQDYVSNFSEDNNSLFYPSVSTSFLLTEAIPGITSTNGLNLVRIRLGYGTSAGFGSDRSYPIANTLNLSSQDFQDTNGAVIASNSSGTRLGNPDLQPERVREVEVGLEARGWDNRVSFDLTWFRRSSQDQIVQRPLDPSTGYTNTLVNVGEIVTRGWEIEGNIDIFRTNEVTWNVGANFTRFRNEVTDLGNVADNIQITGFAGGRGNYAVEGRPLNVILGTRIQRTDDGEFLVNSVGDYVEENGLFEIGDPNPDYILNISSRVSYKGFTFNMLWNYRQGGDVYSATVATLLGRGLTTDTEDRLQTFILPGVRELADGSTVPNDLQINNSSYYFNNILFGPEELQVWDGTTIRLQEISLSYDFPKKWLDKTPFGSVTIVGSGFNLWYKAVNVPDGTNFDPNVAGTGAGNGQGIDFLNGPSSRRYGGTIKFTF